MKIRPLQDRILVKRVDEEETTSGGIIIPDSAKEKPQEGQVIAVGPGKAAGEGEDAPPAPTVKAGDSVLYSKYAGVELEGEDGAEEVPEFAGAARSMLRCGRWLALRPHP